MKFNETVMLGLYLSCYFVLSTGVFRGCSCSCDIKVPSRWPTVAYVAKTAMLTEELHGALQLACNQVYTWGT